MVLCVVRPLLRTTYSYLSSNPVRGIEPEDQDHRMEQRAQPARANCRSPRWRAGRARAPGAGQGTLDRDPVLTAPHDCEDRCTDPSHGAGRLATEVAQESQPLVTPATLPLLTARGAIMPAARRLSPADRQGGRPGAEQRQSF